MKDLVQSLLSIGITVGLSDRESFVKSISGNLEEYIQDPDRAAKVSKAIVDLMEQVKDNINTRNSIEGAVSGIGFAGKKDMIDLTKAIEELTAELRSMKHKV